MKKVAVIGAGVTGLAAAYMLAKKNYQVTVFEKQPGVGGLNAAFETKGSKVDLYYRHIFTHDTYAIDLIKELSLDQHLVWSGARMGLAIGGETYDFETPLDLLRFSPFSFSDKFQFGLSMLDLKFRNDVAEIEKHEAKAWMESKYGKKIFDTIWGPLLYSKFGDLYDKISMAWLWNRIKIRSQSRKSGGFQEQLGYLYGSFSLLTDKLLEHILQDGNQLIQQEVVKIRQVAGKIELTTADGQTLSFDQVLCTTPLSEYYKLLPEQQASPINYVGIVCLILFMRQPFSKYYWLSIADSQSPFGGLMEQTNFVSPAEYGNRHVLYASRYVSAQSELYQSDKSQVLAAFSPYLHRLNPKFSLDTIEESYLYKNSYAQPIVLPNYSKIRPSFDGYYPNLYLANMTHIYPEDRGINFAIRTAKQVVEHMTKG